MIKSTDAYKAAIVGDSRRIYLRAAIDIIDPDITYEENTAENAAAFSKLDQLSNKDITMARDYTTLEANRWILGAPSIAIPDDPAQLPGEVGYVSSVVSGEDGMFSMTVSASLKFSNVDILQACSVFFPSSAIDGAPEDFTVDIIQGGTSYHTETFTGNALSSVAITGFAVYNPDTIKVTITKWSLPGRLARIPEIIPGIYESWDSSILASFSVTQQGNPSCVSLPYGTCVLRMDNLDRRFEPRSKTGVFQSIEDRQGINVYIGVELEDGTVEYKQVGIFYQYSGGWKTGDNDITMQWNLVDIVGLISDRDYIPPSTIPTTLEGWVASIVAQLGTNFTQNYIVDENYAPTAITCTVDKVQGKKCGDILRWACMATGTWPRADAETGYLAVEPLWSEGNKLTLDNMVNYPEMRANNDIAAIIFTLNDGTSTQVIVSGTSAGSPNTVTVDNPFIKTQAAALTAARQILSTYGGNRLGAVGRGDPSSEIGDVDTVWLDEGQATTGRRIYQTFNIQEGVLQGCQSTLLQADGSFLYQNRVQITKSGTFAFPAGVTSARLILVGKGGDGQDGEDGGGSPISGQVPGADGADGLGGLVWYGDINFNDGQLFSVNIEENTVFGPYSSANGQVYANGYTDIANGETYARTGVSSPRTGSGDGGKGGQGGSGGMWHSESRPIYNEKGEQIGWHFYPVVDVEPGKGTPGSDGAYGCVIAYYDKE